MKRVCANGRHGMRYILATTLVSLFAAACERPATEVREVRAFGNEPFWSVTISATGGIVYGRLGEEDILFPAAAPRISESGNGFTFGPVKSDSGEHEIEIRILEEDCQDTMADIVHPMRSTVMLDGVTHSGCARDLAAEPPAERP